VILKQKSRFIKDWNKCFASFFRNATLILKQKAGLLKDGILCFALLFKCNIDINKKQG
jgi:hypothetical protein